MKRARAMVGAAAAIWVAAGQPQSAPRGQELFERRCTGCHAIDRDKEGPRLGGVFGRTAGAAPSFAYSDALKNSGIVWDADTLDRWLADPEKLVPDNNMAFRVESVAERAEIVDYLKRLR